MVRDCRAGEPEGWLHFIAEYMPFCRAVVQHYVPERGNDPEVLQTLLAIVSRPGCPVFDVSGTTPEREFLLRLRNLVLEQLRPSEAERPAPDPATLGEVSPLERQIGWLETMGYDDHATARMMNLDAQTVIAARAKVHAALPGAGLARIALPPASADCASPRLLADYTDGRLTWQRRETVDFHLTECWGCVDLFCRVRESDYLMRRRQPLEPDESDRLRRALGIAEPRTGFWQKVLSVGWR